LLLPCRKNAPKIVENIEDLREIWPYFFAEARAAFDACRPGTYVVEAGRGLTGRRDSGDRNLFAPLQAKNRRNATYRN
jgi:hypothetical protein